MDSVEAEKGAAETQRQSAPSKPVAVAKNGDHAIMKAPVRIINSLEVAYILSVLWTMATWLEDVGVMLVGAIGYWPSPPGTYSAWDTLNMFMSQRLHGPWTAVFIWAMYARGCYVLTVVAYMSHKYRIVYGTSEKMRVFQSRVMKCIIVVLFLNALWLNSMSDCRWRTLLYQFDLLCIAAFMARAIYNTWDNNVVYTLFAPISVRESYAEPCKTGATQDTPKTGETDTNHTTSTAATTVVQFDEGALITSAFVLWIQIQCTPIIFELFAASYHMARPFAHYSALTVLISPHTMLLLLLITLSFYPWNWSRITIGGISVRIFMAAYIMGMMMMFVMVVHPDSIGEADVYRVEQLHANMQLHEDPWGSQFAACGWFVYDHWKPVQLMMLDGERLPMEFLRKYGSQVPPILVRVGFPHSILLNHATLMRYTDYTTILLQYFQERLAPKYNGTSDSPFIIVRTACYFPRLGLSPYGLMSMLGENNTLHYSVDRGEYDGIEYRGASQKRPAAA